MSSDVKTTTTVAEEIPVTTTVAPEQDDNASGDQGATKLAAVENDAVMENNPLAAPEEIKTAKTSESAISSNPAAVDVETPPKAGEVQTSKTEDPDTVPEDAAEPLAADGLSIIAEDYDQTDTEKTDGAEGDEEENIKADTAGEAVDKEGAVDPSESGKRAIMTSEDGQNAKKQKAEDVKLDGASETVLTAGIYPQERPDAVASGA